MKIDRSKLIRELKSFSQKGSGIVIGKPGIGKSHALAELSNQLWDEKIPNLIIRLDQVDGSDNSIASELGVDTDWINALKDVNIANSRGKAVLTFDAFDAAREGSLRWKFLTQIRKALNSLSDKWNVLVSVRSYDASKSPQLLKLFEASAKFSVPELTSQELASAFTQSPVLKKMFSEGNEELKRVLHIPFYLQLLHGFIVRVDTAELEKLKLIQSETQLLDSFWRKRVSETETYLQKENLLRELTGSLVKQMTLSTEKESFAKDIEVFRTLRSADIIDEVGPNENQVAFSHNILFDYIVGRLSIPEDPTRLIAFLKENRSRPFFLRPSFIFYFTRLWYNARDLFWNHYRQLAHQVDQGTQLFSRLIPTSVVANEYSDHLELGPILESEDLIQRLLQSIRFLEGRQVERRDLELLHLLSDRLDGKFLWEFSHVFWEVIQSDKLQLAELLSRKGEVARKFLRFILSERKRTPQFQHSFDRLGSARGIEYVARTYASNREESRKLLEDILDFLAEPDFEIRYFSSLSDDFLYFAEDDPDFVATIYRRILGHREESDSQTNMSPSVVLNLTSTRRQDFEMCYYRLVENFPKFLEKAPEKAIAVGLEIVTNYVIKDKLHLKQYPEDYRVVIVGNAQGKYIPDLSSIWSGTVGYDKPLNIQEKLMEYLNKLTSSNQEKQLFELLNIYFRHAATAYNWKSFINMAIKHQDVFRDQLFLLAKNEAILFHGDTIYEIGQAIELIYPQLSTDQREEVESTILASLTDLTKDRQETENKEYQVNKLLNCIPSDLLQKKESREFIDRHQPIENKPTFSSSFSSRPYTTEQWLKDQGVDTEAVGNKKVLDLIEDLQAFNNKYLNETPDRPQFENLLPLAKQLFSLMRESDDYPSDLKFTSLKNVAEFYGIVSRGTNQLDDKDYDEAKEATLYCLKFYSDHDKNFDSSVSAASGYSSTPRINAALALPGLLRYKNEEEIVEIILKSAQDENPIVRFNVLQNVSQVWLERPTAFWDIAFESLESETDSFTLATVLNNVYRRDIIKAHPSEIDKVLYLASERANQFESRDTFTEILAAFLLYMYNSGNSTAKEILYENLTNTDFLPTLVFKLFNFIDPKYLDNDYTKGEIKEVLLTLLDDIVTKNLELLTQIESASSFQEEGVNRSRLLLIDNIVQRVYFSLDINKNIRKKYELHPTETNQRAFYEKLKPLLWKIIESSKQISGGLIIGHTAHYFMETLNGILVFYPAEAGSVLHMAAEITDLSAKTGYTFDHSAIKEVVKLTETIITDHRDLVMKEESLNHLVSILNMYVESGWQEALELLWRLDEAFR